MEKIEASDFEARCLAILDRVQATGEQIVILKRGRPVAELVPHRPADSARPQADLEDTVVVTGDILSPAVPEEDWDSLN
ncbi:MAG: type II toxin-antitoxin system prevent-host-death family antitoxin [Rhodospirillaceae bacterium]|nr:type II toxin-antitoxin system prevent-host-death family antitoxin [Rhodospirillaceae bacterium]MCY4066829.1 type II toxin-antitoxin system prevent-host-death family antitoxin [Rhodospirillaceae bacterium]